MKTGTSGFPFFILLTTSVLISCKTEPAHETRSDRKDAKPAIHDTLGPRDYAPHP